MQHLETRLRTPESEGTSIKRWFALALWLLFFVLACYCIFGVDVTAETIDWGANNILPAYYFSGWGLALVSVIISLALYPPKIKTSTLIVVSVLALIWLGLEGLRVFSVPRVDTIFSMVDPLEGERVVVVHHSMTMASQLMDFADEVLWVLFLVTLFTQSRNLLGKTWVRIILWALILIGLISCIYSYLNPEQIAEYTKGLDFIRGNGDQVPRVSSFYREKNSFAFVLFLGIAACLILNSERPIAFLYVPIILYFSITIFFTECKTMEYILIVFLPVYTIGRLAATFKGHRIRNSILLSLVVILIVGTVTLFFLFKDVEGHVINRFVELVKRGFDTASETMNGRVKIWRVAASVANLSPFRFFLGWGYRAGEGLAMEFQSAIVGFTQRSSHSGIIDIFLRYGAIGIIAFIVMWVVTARFILRLAKGGRPDLACNITIVLCLFLIYSLDESKIPFYRDVSSLPFLIIGICPALAFDNSVDHKEIYI